MNPCVDYCTKKGSRGYISEWCDDNCDYAKEAKKRKQLEQVLQEIRQEIEQMQNANPSYWNTCDVVDRAELLEIIDEHIKEYTE